MLLNPSANVLIRPITEEDRADILSIYQDGIDTGNATFAASAPDWDGWDTGHLHQCRLVAELSGKVVGWAALSGVSNRCVYGGVAEVSIYIQNAAAGHGIGSKLLNALVEASEASGFWTLQAGIFPENEASISLHRKAGFRILGVREKLGQMTYGRLKGQWRDVVLMERRSSDLGQD